MDYLGDAVLDIDVTPNRPDCLSILGIAHEVAALTGERLTEPDLSYPEEGTPIESQVKIKIADPHLCYRYTASLVSGIKVGPSPPWLQDALVKAGQRPINNVVDITNYAMLEYGQPLHAFDFDTIKDKTIIVRAARPGEVLVSLDGERRTLSPPMLTIADADDAIGLAGIMGGANSEMHEGTTSVLIESASIDPINTRRTASALRLSTEASLSLRAWHKSGACAPGPASCHPAHPGDSWRKGGPGHHRPVPRRKRDACGQDKPPAHKAGTGRRLQHEGGGARSQLPGI